MAVWRPGHAKIDASVGALLVVVPDVLPKHSFEVAFAHNEYPVEAFVRTVLTQRRRRHWPEEIGLAS